MPPPPYAVALTAGGKVLRFSLGTLAAVSTRKGRIVARLDPTFKNDLVVGVEATDGSENVCLATRGARVLIFPVTEANVVAGAARGVSAIKLELKDRVIGFVLANKKREGLSVRTSRGAIQIVRATKYPVTARGGRGYAILQRGALECVLPSEAEPVPSQDQVGDPAGMIDGVAANGRAGYLFRRTNPIEPGNQLQRKCHLRTLDLIPGRFGVCRRVPEHFTGSDGELVLFLGPGEADTTSLHRSTRLDYPGREGRRSSSWPMTHGNLSKSPARRSIVRPLVARLDRAHSKYC